MVNQLNIEVLMITFVIGIFLGGIIGVFSMALVTAGKDDNKSSDDSVSKNQNHPLNGWFAKAL